MRKIVLLFILMFFVSVLCLGAHDLIRTHIGQQKGPVEMKYNTFKEMKKACRLINFYWEILEYRYQFIDGTIDAETSPELVEKYLGLIEEYNDLVKNMSLKLGSEDYKVSSIFQNFSEFYQTCPEESRPALDTVVSNILVKFNYSNPALGTTDNFIRQYFPGYGYTDPEYWYRKGREVDREFLYARWQEEEKTYMQSKLFELTVELKLVAGLTQKYPNLEVIGKFPVNIGGHIVICAKVKFETKEGITIKTKKKIGEFKLWFELLKAKKTIWSDPKWEPAGKTYEFFEEPTGEEVTTGVRWD